MKNTSEAVLNAFKPVHLLPQAAQEHTASHQERHNAAALRLGTDSFILQHHTLSFVSELLTAEPASLQHLRAQALWEVAYGHQVFFWGTASAKGTASGLFNTSPSSALLLFL